MEIEFDYYVRIAPYKSYYQLSKDSGVIRNVKLFKDLFGPNSISEHIRVSDKTYRPPISTHTEPTSDKEI